MGDKKEKKEKKEKAEKEPKSAKKEKPQASDDEAQDGAPVVRRVIPIAKPMADDKLAKKLLKVAKKAAKKKQIRRGVKEVVKALRKNVKGICIIAADISPIDVVTHIPVLCEDNHVPYVFVPSKDELGAAGLTKRPTSVMLVMPKPAKGKGEDDKEFDEGYAECEKKLKGMQSYA